jgi:hypothetical protein
VIGIRVDLIGTHLVWTDTQEEQIDIQEEGTPAVAIDTRETVDDTQPTILMISEGILPQTATQSVDILLTCIQTDILQIGILGIGILRIGILRIGILRIGIQRIGIQRTDILRIGILGIGILRIGIQLIDILLIDILQIGILQTEILGIGILNDIRPVVVEDIPYDLGTPIAILINTIRTESLAPAIGAVIHLFATQWASTEILAQLVETVILTCMTNIRQPDLLILVSTYPSFFINNICLS